MYSCIADDNWYAMHDHPWASQIVGIVNMMHITAMICFCIREFDMAGSNKRMIAHEDNLICASSNSIAPINKFCDSHANNHVQSDVV